MSESFQLCIISVQDVPASLSVRWIYQLSKYLAWMMALDYLHRMSSAFFLLVCLVNCWDRHWFKFKDVLPMRNHKVSRTTISSADCGSFVLFLVGLKIACINLRQLLCSPPYYLFGALIIRLLVPVLDLDVNRLLQSASLVQLGIFDRDIQYFCVVIMSFSLIYQSIHI